MKTKVKKKELFFIILLIFTIICSYIPYTAYAEMTEISETSQSVEVEDTTISIDNDEGAFPEGSELSVVPVENDKKIKKIVSKERDKNEKVAFSNTYDIKMLGENDKEIQPDKEISLIFENEYFKDKNLNANIYHIVESEDGLEAKKLVTEQDGDEITAKTNGFSYYTVEFTYNNLQYSMEGDSTIKLSKVLDFVGLEGEVTDVYSSNDELFSFEKIADEWYVKANKPFHTNEWMKVTIDDIEYMIVVTDASYTNITINKKWSDSLTGTEATNRPVPKVKLSYGPNKSYAYAVYDSSDNSLTFFRDDAGKYSNNQVVGTKTYYSKSGTQTLEEGPEYDWIGETSWPWHNVRESITSIKFEDNIKPKKTNYWFYDMENLTSITGLEYLDTSECTNMQSMFKMCTNLGTVDLSHFNTSSVTNTKEMFYFCYKINTTLNIMKMPTTYDSMFSLACMTSGKVTLKYISPVTSANIDTLKATGSSKIVNGGVATSLSPIIQRSGTLESNDTNWVKTNDTTWTYTFSVPTDSAENMKVWESNVPNRYTSSADENNKITLSNTTSVTITNTYKSENDIVITKKWNDGLTGSDATNRTAPTVSLSYGNEGLTAYAVFDSSDGSLTFFRDTSNAHSNNQTIGTKKYYKGFETATYSSASSVPWNSNVESITSVKFNDNINPVSTAHWFEGMTNLTNITGTDKFDTSKVTNMSYMFSDCSSLTSLDLSHFNTSKVTNMSRMFDGCESLTSLDVSHFNTSKVTNMSGMFDSCYLLTTLDVSHFDTSNVTTTFQMFALCRKLTTLDVSHFNTSKVTNISSMFYACKSLTTLDVSHFNTSNVTDMEDMFHYCESLTSLDVSHFNTSNVTEMDGMFGQCHNLTSLDVSHFDTSKVTDMFQMFSLCYKLTATLNIKKMPTKYDSMCYETAKTSGKLTLNYISPVTSANIDTLVATKENGNVVNGGQGTFTAPTAPTILTPTAPTDPLPITSLSGTLTSTAANWVKANDNTWTYVFTVPNDAENIKIWESSVPSKYFTDNDSSNKISVTGDSATITNTQVRGTIKFEANGGSGTMADQEYYYKYTNSLNSNRFTNDGLRFKEWNTAANGTGTSYEDRANILTEFPRGGTIILYAQWKPTPNIIFNANGGEGYMEDQSYIYGTTSTLNANKYENEGYRFKGWNTKRDGSGDWYADKANVKTSFSEDNDTTLYAQWESTNAIIRFNGNGSTKGNMDDQELKLNEKSKLNANKYTKEEYVFKEWNTNSSGTGISYKNKAEVTIGSNILNGTDNPTTLTSTGLWSAGKFKSENTGTGTRELESITDSPVPGISKAYKIQSNNKNNDIAQMNVPVEIGKTYTISCYAKGKGTLNLGYGNRYSSMKNSTTTVNSSNDWKLYQYTFTATSSYASGNVSNIYFGNRSTDTSGYLYITGLKLEEGNTASAYVKKDNELTLYAQFVKGKYSIEGETEMNGYQFNWMTPTNGRLEVPASLANDEFYTIFDVDDKAKYKTTESKNAAYIPSYEVTKGSEYVNTRSDNAEKGEALATPEETVKGNMEYTFKNVKNIGSNYLTVKKKVTGDVVTATDKSKQFTFSYYITGVDPSMTYPLVKIIDETETFTDLTPTSAGVLSGTITLKDGDSFRINVPAGAKYNITEKTGVSSISNWPYKSSYEVSSDCTGYEYVNSKSATGITSLPNGGNTIYGLSINQNGSHNAQGLGQEIMPEADVDYIFRNAKVNYHNLTVKKQVDIDNSTNISSDDTFTVNMKFSNLEPNSTYTASNSAYNIVTDENGKATVIISIKGRQEVTFNNLPGDVEYTAIEEESNYTPNVKIITNGNTIYETTSLFGQGVEVSNQENRITSTDEEQEIGFDANQTLLFTNSRKLNNNLKVQKRTYGQGAKSTDEFTYQVAFTDITVKDYQVVKETLNDDGDVVSTTNSTYHPSNTNDTYSFALKNNQAITIKGIPNTAKYKITENAFAGYAPFYEFVKGASKTEEGTGEAKAGTALSTETEELVTDAEILFTNTKDIQPPEKTVSDFDNKTWDGTGTETNVTENTVPDKESEWEYKITQTIYSGYKVFKFNDYLPANLVLTSSPVTVKWTKENGTVVNETLSAGNDPNTTTDYKSAHFKFNIDDSSIYAESTDTSFIEAGGTFEIRIKVKVNPKATNDDFASSGQIYKINESLLFKNKATTFVDEMEYKSNLVKTRIPLNLSLNVSKNVTGNAGNKTKEFDFTLNLSGLKANKRYTYDKPTYVDVSSDYKNDELTLTAKNENGEPVNDVELKFYSVGSNETTGEEELHSYATRETNDEGKASLALESGEYKYEYSYENETISGYFTAIHSEETESVEEIDEIFIPRNDYDSDKYFVTDEKGKAEINFTLIDGQTMAFNNLPKDVIYQITEKESDHMPSYEVTRGAGNVNKTSDQLTQTGELSTKEETLKDSVEYLFTNNKVKTNKTKGTIRVSKQWVDDTASNRPNNIVVNLVKKQKEQTGEAYASFDSATGILRFFTDTTGKYENGQTEGTKTYFTGIKNTGTAIDGHPWAGIKSNVTKVTFDSVIKPDTVIYWFNGMTNLRSVQGLDKLDTSDVVNFTGMFNGCESLESLDLSGLDTSSATDMRVMFASCKSLTELDLSRFDTSNVKMTSSMFNRCENLRHIYVSDKWSMDKVTVSEYMFGNDSNLPHYISSIVDKTYAHYGSDGYLEYRAYKAPGTIATSDEWTKDGDRWTYNYTVDELEEGFKYYVYEERLNGYESNASEQNMMAVNDNNANIVNTRVSAHTVIVTKKVKGNLGDLTKEFEFTANFTGLASNTNYGSFTSNASGNGTCTFKLKSGQSKTFEHIPDSSVLVVTEAKSNHTASVKVTNPNVLVTKSNSNKEMALSTGNVSIVEDTTVAFTNQRDLETITSAGSTMIIIFIILLAAGLIVFFRIKHRRSTDDLAVF